MKEKIINLELIEENGKISLHVPFNNFSKEMYNIILKFQTSEIDQIITRSNKIDLDFL